MKGMLKKPFVWRCLLLFNLFLAFAFESKAQTDTEFWFVVPYTTTNHGGGTPALMTFSAFDMPSQVTISMPANPAFNPIVVDVPARTAVTVDLSAYVKKAANPDLENRLFPKPNTYPNSCGLYIKATTIITAYYNIANTNNTEIYALKGKNALGTEFYVPFQNARNNHYWGAPNQAYSSINIVATEDNTTVNIKPTKDAVTIKNGNYVNIAANSTFTITLNKGQCISVAPGKDSKTYESGALHLGGTLVTSDKDIAITINDDSINGEVNAGNYDTLGDQLVNMESLGKTYVVLRTKASESGAKNDDDAYVLATKDNTVVTIKNNDGSVVTNQTLNAGEIFRVKVSGNYCILDATEKISVWHVGGFGSELGGAVLPAVDKCTGSTQVAFNKLSQGGKTFNVNLMVRTSGKNSFKLNGKSVDFETAAGKTWTQVGSSEWWFMQVLDWNKTKLPSLIEGQGNILTNDDDLFHFGVFYGASSGGCNYGYFSDFNELKISSAVAGVDAGETKVCFGVPIQIYAQGGNTYKWTPATYLSDSTVYNPIANIPVSGTQKYTVEVSGLCGMTDTKEITLQIFPPVEANFSVDKMAGCSPLEVEFTNTSLNANSLEWFFGDGNTAASVKPSLVENFTHTFENNSDTARTFTVQLRVKGESGCGDIVEKRITVYPSVKAELLRIDPTPQYCSPRTVSFQNTSPATPLPDADITYIWNYGDGVTDNTHNKDVSHEFSVLGKDKMVYNVSLTMVNKFGCKSTVTDTSLTVYGLVTSDFSLDNANICPSTKGHVSSTGLISSSNPNVSISVTDISTGPIVSRTWNNSWNGWGGTTFDGTTGANPFDKTYPYTGAATTKRTVTLEVTGVGGCKSSKSQEVTIYPYVKAGINFGASPNFNICDGSILNIKNASSAGSTNLVWDFGDGNAVVGDAVTSHKYENPTIDPVDLELKLTAMSSEGGCKDSVIQPIRVYSRILPKFSVDNQSGCAPLATTFTNSTLANSKSVYKWEVDAANNGVSFTQFSTAKIPASQQFVNTTTLPKDYIVKLTVTNESIGGACSESAERTVRVYPQPVAKFTFDTDKGCNPLPVTFTSADNVASYDYYWAFGDGATSDVSPKVSHTYNNYDPAVDQVFNALLEVSNIYGCKSVFTKDITVNPYLKAGFTLTQTECTPVKVTVTPASIGATAYSWSLSGGTIESGNTTSGNPFTVVYDNVGAATINPTIALEVTNNGGVCKSSDSKTVTVLPKVVADGSFAIVDKCKGVVEFTNASTGSTGYVWDFKDGQTSSSLDAKITHTYLNRSATNANYSASLTATNIKGCTSQKIFNIDIVPRVESHFALVELDKCTPKRIQLTNTSLNGNEFRWDYGHSIGGVAQKETKTDKVAFDKIIDSESLNDILTYKIKLTAVDNNTNCQDESTVDLPIYPRVKPSFTADTYMGCSNLPVEFTNTSTGGTMSFAWNFGDGQSAKTALVTEKVNHEFVNRTSSNVVNTVKLTATNPIGCTAEFTNTITAYPKVEANFTFIQPSKCTPFPIDITNSSLNGTKFSWDFGHTVGGINRDTVTVDKKGFRTYIYNSDPSASKTYTLTLKAEDGNGCSTTVTKTVEAKPEVHANFNLSVEKGCNPLTVSYENVSTGSSLYAWTLGDGNTSSLLTPATRTYSNNDTVSIKQYTVTLMSKNADGCENTVSKNINVYPKILADFNIDNTQGCTPFKVNVKNAYMSSSYGYEWSLGSNGQNNSAQLPLQTFLNLTPDFSIQKETLKLKVFYKNDVSCFKEVEKTINIYPRTQSDFSMDVSESCSPVAVNFTNKSKSFNSSTAYKWRFDNLATSSAVDPSYVFKNLSHTDNAVYTVSLKSVSVHGCTDSITRNVTVRPVPKAEIAINETSACAPFNVKVDNLSIGASPVYKYWLAENSGNVTTKTDASSVGFTIDNLQNTTKSSVVWHKIISDFGCVDSTSQVVYTYPYVKSQFSFSPVDRGCNPLSVNFTNESQNAEYFTWDFDDGITTHVEDPNHIFHNLSSSDKTFNVKLNAKSEYGCENSSYKEFTVYPAPMAYFTIDPPLRTYPDASFLVVNKTTPMNPTWTYEWSYGDGGKYTGVTPPVYTYKTWGPEDDDYKYYVTLKVNNGNCSDELTQYLFLKPAVPIAIFDASVGQSCAPLVTQFTHEAQYYSSILWDFGDGTTSTESSPIHEYKNPGRYYVQLTVNGVGGVTYAYKTLYVHPNPVASFKFAPEEAMLPEGEVHFYNTSLEGSTFSWDFGDGVGSSTEQNPVYNYKNLGVYDVRLTVTSENGCVDDTLLKQSVKVIGEGLLKFPNAFIPNPNGGNGGIFEIPDYKNEVFHPVFAGVVTYKLLIYNRWGVRLFESDDINLGWDGYYKGKLCEQGVYVYRAQGRFTNGKTFDVRGDVTLLR